MFIDRLISFLPKEMRRTAIAPTLGVTQPFPKRLYYAYPPCNEQILSNIAVTIREEPKFYLQILHLMNKMNLPPPFKPQSSLQHDIYNNLKRNNTSNNNNNKFRYNNNNNKKMNDQIVEYDDDDEEEEELSPQRKKIKLDNENNNNNNNNKITISNNENNQIRKQNINLTKVNEVKNNNANNDNNSHSRNNNDDDNNNMRNISEGEEGGGDESTKKMFESLRLQLGNKNNVIKKLSIQQIKELPRFQNYEVGENRTEKIYVKNIAKNVSEDLFTSIFNLSKSSGDVDLKIKFITKGRMRGQAFVTFPSSEEATKAINNINGLLVCNKPLILQYSTSNDE